jgi:uracil-DNA glycosylase family 4
MSFFITEKKNELKTKIDLNNINVLHKYGCYACPLNKAKLTHPKFNAEGPTTPLLYFLGESPGVTEDKDGGHFIGKSGRFLRKFIPDDFDDKIRWNNVINCRPTDKEGKDRPPEQNEVECCRKRIIADIEQTKPKIIFGFGYTPLNWVLGISNTSITDWRGRRSEVWIGNHKCWFYSFYHPSFVLRKQQEAYENKRTDIYGNLFELDLIKAFLEVEDLPEAQPESPKNYFNGIECYNLGDSDYNKIIDFISYMKNSTDKFGFDIETNGLVPFKKGSKILSMAFSTGSRTVGFSLDHVQAGWTDAQRRGLKTTLKDFFCTNSKCSLIVHNGSFEKLWISYFFDKECVLNMNWEDSMAQSYILDNRSSGGKSLGGDDKGGGVLSLDSLIMQHFGFPLKSISNVDRENLDNADVYDVVKYNCCDSKYTKLLFEKQKIYIEEQELQNVYVDQDKRTTCGVMCSFMGVSTDQEFIKESSKILDARIIDYNNKIYDLQVVKDFEKKTGRKFDKNSNKDLVEMFRDFMEIPSIKETKKGGYSVDKDSLEKMDNELAKLITEHRHALKFKSTYINNLILENNSDVYPDLKVHPGYSTMYTTTRRASAEKPNIQNQPKRVDKELVRPAFIPDKDCVLVEADYGQIEARVIGMLSKDENFCRMLWNNYDTHAEWAKKIIAAYPKIIGGKENAKDPVKFKKIRDKAKNKFVFPAFFGSSCYSIAGYLNIPVDMFKPVFNEFWETFPGVKEWQKKQEKFYLENGFVQGATGFRMGGALMWSDIINYPIQNTASEIFFDAFYRLVARGIKEDKPELIPIINVHDSLTFNIPKKELDNTLDIIVTEMLGCKFDFINVPLAIELTMSDKNWFEMSNKEAEIGTFYSHEWNK